MHSLAELLADFGPIGLRDLDERAALQRRVDHKYVLTREQLADALERLARDHEALQIDGERTFGYDSVYFDTPSLQAFHDHVADRERRWKIRTRLYVDSGDCQFEIKLKQGDRTDKKSLDYDAADRHEITAEAERFIADVLGELPAEGVRPSLITRFRRSTISPTGSPARATIDERLELVLPEGGRSASLDPDYVLLETKSEDGRSPCDRILHEHGGLEPVSISKYRLGIGLLVARDPAPPLGAARDRLFGVAR